MKIDNEIEQFNRHCEEKAKEQGLTIAEYKDLLFDMIDKLPKVNPYECEEYLKAQLNSSKQ